MFNGSSSVDWVDWRQEPEGFGDPEEQEEEEEQQVVEVGSMANDSRFVLAQLVRSGIWSKLGDVFRHKHFVLDADSVVTYLYKKCLANHLQRQKSLLGRSRVGRRRNGRVPVIDYYAATIVNYQEFGRYVEQLLDFFASHSIELHIVYRGKHMEAPLFGLLPAQVKKNAQRASEPLDMLIEYNKSLMGVSTPQPAQSNTSHSSVSRSMSSVARKDYSVELYMSQLRPSRPNLALNVFKQVVNGRRRATTKRVAPISTHQAYYSPYPKLAQLARDYKCPVLTNDGDFIIMDVRAGFVLFEDLFRTFFVSQNLLARHPSTSSAGSTVSGASGASGTSGTSGVSVSNVKGSGRVAPSSSRNRLLVSPKSPAVSLTDSKHLFDQTRTGKIKFHLNSLFLRQHPGLNQSLVLHLFPLTTGEFIVTHAKSMINMRIYNREFTEQDLISVARDLSPRTSAKKYHMAAARLEMVARYLCTKDPGLLNCLLRGEAHRLLASGSTFDDDYKQLFNYYAVNYDFKTRLKFVLRHLTDQSQLSYLEKCLVERECSADFLLNLLPCSVGKISSVCYNKSMQFEDLQTRHSAFAMLDSSKRLVMAMLSGNKSSKAEHSISLSDRERAKISARFKTASLTVVDRQQNKQVERNLGTASQVVLKQTLTLDLLAKQTTSAGTNEGHRAAMALMELAFEQTPGSFVKLAPAKVVQLIQAGGGLQRPGDKFKQLAILLNLHRFTLSQAAFEDPYFKLNYLGLSQPFELALAKQFVYSNLAGAESSLIDLIAKFDLENVARFSLESPDKPVASKSSHKPRGSSRSSVGPGFIGAGKSKITNQASSTSQTGDSILLTRQRIRHLIELLNSSLEAYCELNAFLNYPLPQLDLARGYNPILLFNLTLHQLAG